MPKALVNASRQWRIAFFSLLAGALLGIGVLLYGIVDQGITITYMSEGYAQTKQDLSVLAAAFPRDGYNKKDIVTILREQNPDAFIVETECTVELNGLRFEFDDQGSLVGINTGEKFSPDAACGP